MKANKRKYAWYQPVDWVEEPAKDVRSCDHPGCSAAGEYRAPKSRERLNDYYWFCLEHVRDYNASWDFYKGMSVDDIEREMRQTTTWDRPTWPLGSKMSSRRFQFEVHDPLGAFEAAAEELHQKNRARHSTPEEKALAVLGLTPPISVKQLKAHYKTLVKQHHPDANGGDKQAEERFKDISQAYKLLLDRLTA